METLDKSPNYFDGDKAPGVPPPKEPRTSYSTIPLYLHSTTNTQHSFGTWVMAKTRNSQKDLQNSWKMIQNEENIILRGKMRNRSNILLAFQHIFKNGQFYFKKSYMALHITF